LKTTAIDDQIRRPTTVLQENKTSRQRPSWLNRKVKEIISDKRSVVKKNLEASPNRERKAHKP